VTLADNIGANHWHRATDLAELPAGARKVVRLAGAQIVVFHLDDGRLIATDNRCPHEGYPLSEGDLATDGGCVLTCNWHNWKFDLLGGETLVGGDRLRLYPVRVADGAVEIEVVPPAPEVVIASALDGMTAGFERHEYDRFAREIARLMSVGGDPLDAVRRAIHHTHDLFEFGTTHAMPGASDWLSLRAERADDPHLGLAALTESVGHFAWDTRRHPAFPYTEGAMDWSEDAFVSAIEAENAFAAAALVRGAVEAGLGWPELEPAFARAALAHYADFGHSAIYTYKMRALTAHLNDAQSLLELALMLTRALVYQSREDLIPEFRHYGKALAAWGTGDTMPAFDDLTRGSVRSILDALVAGSALPPEQLFELAYEAAAQQMLHYDMHWQTQTGGAIAKNVGWLDFTHGLTFANAGRKLAERDVSLWPAVLLQMGCFLGRNAGFTDWAQDVSQWQSDDPTASVAACLDRAIDHGQGEYIVSVHLIKLSYAIREEAIDRPDALGHDSAAAALNRFMNSPLRRRHTIRTARQALEFVG